MWTADGGWGDGAGPALRALPARPRGGGAALRPGDLRGHEGLPARRRLDLDLPPRGQRRALARSARRLALPELPEDDFVASLRQLVAVDQAWVPAGDAGEKSLYLRPFMFASEAFLGVRPAQQVTYSVIASPAGAYFSGGLKPVTLWISTDYARAGEGGTGAAKCGGNYAARSRASSRASSTAATRRSSSTPRRTPTSRSSVA